MEICGEETESESLVINEVSLMDMHEPQNHTGKEKNLKYTFGKWTQTQCNTHAAMH